MALSLSVLLKTAPFHRIVLHHQDDSLAFESQTDLEWSLKKDDSEAVKAFESHR